MINKIVVYAKARAKYGDQLQKIVCMEELSELIKEISKEMRGKSTKTQIISEIADVRICIDQLMLMDQITEQEVEEEMKYKLNRLDERIDDELEEEYETRNKTLQERVE